MIKKIRKQTKPDDFIDELDSHQKDKKRKKKDKKLKDEYDDFLADSAKKMWG